MKRVDEYITNYEANQFCANCNEICSRHCVVWRNALQRYDQEEKKEKAGEEMATSEAALKAQKKYDEAHKEDYTSFHIKLNNDTDAELIAHIKAQKNKNGYFRELVRKDIDNEYVKEIMNQKKELGIDCPPIKSIEIVETGGN